MKQIKKYETTDHLFMVEIEENKVIVEDESGNDRIEKIRKLNVTINHKIENGTRIEAYWDWPENRLIGELEVCGEVIPTLIAIRDGKVVLEEVELYGKIQE